MNKVLLFYPSFSEVNQEKTLYTDIPLSVVALAQKLHNKFHIMIIDERIDYSFDIADKLKDVFAVGISATTSYQIINGLKFARSVRNYNKNIKIIWGGWHPSLMSCETIEHELVDIIIIGQGEIILASLLTNMKQENDMNIVPNIIYKSKDGDVVKTKQKLFMDLQMPPTMIDGYKYISIENYIHNGWGNQKVLGYESSRGCPFACSFCSISAIFQKKWYGLPSENVVYDIRYLKEKYNIDAIHFFDNNFFVDRTRAFDIANKLKLNKVDIKWDGTVVIKQFLKFTQKEMEFLKSSGFYRIIVGIESGDEEVLNKINKKHSNDEVLEVVKRCKEYGILPSLSFMVGFPWNPEKDTANTIRLIEQIKKINSNTEILLFAFSPYLGTPLYEIAKEYHMKFPSCLESWSEFTYDKTNTPWVSNQLKRKIERYLTFFGTKEMAANHQLFLKSFE